MVEGGPIQQISGDGGTEPIWSKDGKELFYRQLSKMMVVRIETDPELQPGVPEVLFESPYEFSELRGSNYDVAPDGKRFLMVRTAEQEIEKPWELHVVLNWFEELKRLVPTN